MATLYKVEYASCQGWLDHTVLRFPANGINQPKREFNRKSFLISLISPLESSSEAICNKGTRGIIMELDSDHTIADWNHLCSDAA